MVATASFLAACSLFALSLASPISKTAADSVVARGAYVMFGGDGTVARGWPSRKSWLSFRDAWEANLETIRNSCQVEGWGENNSDAETQAIKDSITEESGASGVPEEFILAIMMQESKGCVRAPTTAWAHANPGLMQSAEGKGSCNPDGNPISPCPATEIRQMIHDGTNGDGLETTLKQCVADAGTTDDSKWYKAARLYNAGKITDDNLGIGPTPCYASDIANRLTSPFNWSVCDNAVIGSLSSARTDAEVDSTPDESNVAPTTTKPAPAPTSNSGEFAETTEVPDTIKPANVIDGAAAGCTEYYVPKSGDTCASAPVDLPTLLELNPQLNPECTNLWADYGYCVAV